VSALLFHPQVNGGAIQGVPAEGPARAVWISFPEPMVRLRLERFIVRFSGAARGSMVRDSSAAALPRWRSFAEASSTRRAAHSAATSSTKRSPTTCGANYRILISKPLRAPHFESAGSYLPGQTRAWEISVKGRVQLSKVYRGKLSSLNPNRYWRRSQERLLQASVGASNSASNATPDFWSPTSRNRGLVLTDGVRLAGVRSSIIWLMKKRACPLVVADYR